MQGPGLARAALYNPHLTCTGTRGACRLGYMKNVMCTTWSVRSYIVHHWSVRRYRSPLMQAAGAWRRSMVHNVVLSCWSGAQCMSHKPRHTNKQTDGAIFITSTKDARGKNHRRYTNSTDISRVLNNYEYGHVSSQLSLNVRFLPTL